MKKKYIESFNEELTYEYDEISNQVFPLYEESQKIIKQPIIDYIKKNNKQNNIKILESGYGTLQTTKNILEVSPNICVEGYDDSVEMFKQSVESLKKMAHEKGEQIKVGSNSAAYYTKDGFLRILIHCMDIEKGLIQTENNTFDGFASGYMLHNLPSEQRKKIFKQLARVIKSGGFFVNSDKYAHDNDVEHRENYDKQIKLFDLCDKMGYPKMKEEWIEHYIKDEKIKFTEKEQLKMFQKYGFVKGKKLFREMMHATYVAEKK